MIVIGFGGTPVGMTAEEETAWLEQLAVKMQQMLEEHGWSSNFGRDPVLILIEQEDEDEETDQDD